RPGPRASGPVEGPIARAPTPRPSAPEAGCADPPGFLPGLLIHYRRRLGESPGIWDDQRRFPELDGTRRDAEEAPGRGRGDAARVGDGPRSSPFRAAPRSRRRAAAIPPSPAALARPCDCRSPRPLPGPPLSPTRRGYWPGRRLGPALGEFSVQPVRF